MARTRTASRSRPLTRMARTRTALPILESRTMCPTARRFGPCTALLPRSARFYSIPRSGRPVQPRPDAVCGYHRAGRAHVPTPDSDILRPHQPRPGCCAHMAIVDVPSRYLTGWAGVRVDHSTTPMHLTSTSRLQRPDPRPGFQSACEWHTMAPLFARST